MFLPFGSVWGDCLNYHTTSSGNALLPISTVGGIKEKILAAKRAGIKDIILCEENRKNIEEIQPMYLEGLTFHYVTDIKEVLALALTNEKVNGAIDFNITNQKTEEKK